MPKPDICLLGLALIVAIGSTEVRADHWVNVPLRPQPPGMPAGPYPVAAQRMAASRGPIQQVSGVTSHGGAALGGPMYGPVMMPAQRGYPQMHAPLYPSPVPNVPVQVGGTTITNQALAPHEMMYPHEYKGLYPPFYYKVSGGWLWTPWGIESHDKWKLQGTEVKVKYRSHYAWYSGFHPPVLR